MSPHNPGVGGHQFQTGDRCLLTFLDQRYMVGVITVRSDAIRVSYPVSDFPIPGMGVRLEHHDEHGFGIYEAEVIESAKAPGDGLLLSQPVYVSRNHHRATWRVPTAFKAELKDHVHPRRVEAPILNLSAGGMLVRTNAHLNVGDNVDVGFSLPEHGRETVLASVVHLTEASEARGNICEVGLKFIDLDPYIGKAIAQFVWLQMRAEQDRITPL